MSHQIDSAKVLYSAGGNDECHTPAYGVAPILEFVKPKQIIWCPFDTDESWFVRLLRTRGNDVIASHIRNGQDFHEWEPSSPWDVIISNPPFTAKRKIFERALSFNKPFALLMSNTWLNDAAPKQLWAERELQLLMFDKRIEFNGNAKITFSSSYFCTDFLPRQIIMRKLNKGE